MAVAKKLLTAFICALAIGARGWCGPTEDCLKPSAPEARISACSSAISAWKENDGARSLYAFHTMRGIAAVKLGLFARALADLDRAAELNPSADEPFINRGWAYLRAGDYPGAEKDFEKTAASKNQKNSAWAYYSLALAHYLQGNSSVAEKELAAARGLAPELYGKYEKEYAAFAAASAARLAAAEKSFSAGKAALYEGNMPLALNSFQLALSSSPGNIEYGNWLGSALLDAGRHEDALRMLGFAPEAERWNYYIGLALFQAGRLEEASKALTDALQDAPAKNRGQNIAADARNRIARIAAYLSGVEKARKAVSAGDGKTARESLREALGAIETAEAKKLLEQQLAAEAEHKTAVRNRIALSIVLLLLLAAAFYVGKGMFARYANIKSERKDVKDSFYSSAAEKPPRDAVMAYFDYKPNHEAEAPQFAARLMRKVAVSRDFETIKSFSGEFAPENRREFLLLAAETYIKAGTFEASMDALQLLNMIPFGLWLDEESAVFVTAHLVTDELLLSNRKVDEGIWPQDPAASASVYLPLAQAYLDKKNYPFLEAVLDRLPSYKWEPAHWDLLLKSREATGRLDTVDVAAVPVEYKLRVLEALVRQGRKEKVTEFLINEPRQNWLKEYYFYMFLYSLRDRWGDPSTLYFDASWEYYKQLADKFDVKAAPLVHYVFAIACEKAGRFDMAARIYRNFKSASPGFRDAVKRLELMEGGSQSSLSPTADQLLAPLLPKDFFPK